jgi:hypothetical protein
MNLDRALAIFGALGTVLGLWLAYYFYRKTVRSKVLSIAYTSSVPLVLPVPDVTVLYRGINRSELSRAFILLWNKGTAPIEEDDFLSPISINGEKVVDVKIVEKDAAAAGNVHSDEKAISITLLRPSEAIVLEVNAAEQAYKPDLTVQMKSSDMSVRDRIPRALLPAIIGSIVGILVLAGAIMLIDWWGKFLVHWGMPSFFASIEDEDMSWSQNTIINLLIVFYLVVFFLLIPLSFGVLGNWIAKHFLGTISPVRWRFYQTQSRLLGARSTYQSLLKVIEHVTRQ